MGGGGCFSAHFEKCQTFSGCNNSGAGSFFMLDLFVLLFFLTNQRFHIFSSKGLGERKGLGGGGFAGDSEGSIFPLPAFFFFFYPNGVGWGSIMF